MVRIGMFYRRIRQKNRQTFSLPFEIDDRDEQLLYFGSFTILVNIYLSASLHARPAVRLRHMCRCVEI